MPGAGTAASRTNFRTRTRFPTEFVECRQDALADAPPAISVQGKDHCKEDKDWGAKRRRLMVGGSNRVKGVMGVIGQIIQSARPIWHATRSIRHSI